MLKLLWFVLKNKRRKIGHLLCKIVGYGSRFKSYSSEYFLSKIFSFFPFVFACSLTCG